VASALETAIAAEGPYLLEVVTRGDVPMPRTGYWDIADFLKGGNGPKAKEIPQTIAASQEAEASAL